VSDPAPAFAPPDADAPWRPDPASLADHRATRLLARAGEPSLEALQGHAVADPAWFWGAAVDDLELAWQRPWSSVLDLAGGIELPRWWAGGAFDHAGAVLARWTAAGMRDAEALAWEGDDGAVLTLTGSALVAEVEAAADRFAAHGVGDGTRVGVFLPMLPETVITVLALGRLRAVFTPLFSGYAAPAVAARLRAFDATHLVTADGFRRRGGVIDMASVACDAVGDAPSVRRVVVVERLGGGAAREAGLADPLRDARWSDGPSAEQAAALPPAERRGGLVDPETPYMVIYTSGTTGAP